MAAVPGVAALVADAAGGLTTENAKTLAAEIAKNDTNRRFKDGLSMISSLPMKFSAYYQIFAWVSIILMIIVIVIFFSIQASKGKYNAKISRMKNNTLSGFSKLLHSFDTALTKLQSFFQLSPGQRTLLNRFNPYEPDIPSVQRDKSYRGRCDNLYYKESSTFNVCDSTLDPPSIEWELDIRQFPEFAELPSHLQEELVNKLKVKIPWKVNSTFYSPQCNEATFADGTKADHLLEDYGMSCKLKENTTPDFTGINLGTNRLIVR